MSKIGKAIFGAAAITLSLGAAELASGHDVAGSLRALTATPYTTINRAAKADRAPAAAAVTAPTQTISLRLEALSNTSILIRVPPAYRARSDARDPSRSQRPVLPDKSTQRKLTVACEPVVSTLTEVAKLLQPGRCVT